MNFVDITPAMTADACTINGRDYKITSDSVFGYEAYNAYNAILGNGVYRASNGSGYAWLSNNTAFPHWWKLDMGGNSILSGVEFTPADDNVDCVLKDFKIEVSMDDITYETVVADTNTNKTIINYYNTTTINPLKYTLAASKLFRYIKITILNGYNSRGYTWAGFYHLKLTGILDCGYKTYKDLMNDLYGYK